MKEHRVKITRKTQVQEDISFCTSSGVIVELIRDMDTPCIVETFTINKIKASLFEFGKSKDISNSEIKAYTVGCRNRVFIPYICNDRLLLKYNINEEDYNEIIQRLTKTLSLGNCKCC